jgi:sentrin-specific protease 7
VNNIPRKLDTDGTGTSLPTVHSTAEPNLEPSGQHIEDELALAAASYTLGETLVPGYGEAFEILDEGDSKINLIDADAVETNGDLPTVTAEAVSTRPSPAAETARMEELSLSDPPADGILKQSVTASLSAKRKAKKRPLPKYDLDKSIIVILDSLEGNHAKAVRVLKDYILEEGRAKRGIEATIEQKTFYVKSNHIPMQENFSDCGVFLLGYAEKFFANPREFSNRLLSREMDTETDWPNMNASEMRHDMRKILQDLAEKQKAEHKQNKKAAKVAKTAPPPLVKTDISTPTPQLQSPFKENSYTRAEVRSKSPRQPTPAQVGESPTNKGTLPPLAKTGVPAPKPEQQRPFQVKPPAKPETRSKSPRQWSLERGEVSPSRKERKPSPMVVIPSPARNSPKRQMSTSTNKNDNAGTGTAGLYSADRNRVAVEIRSPKRQKQSHAQTVSSRHWSPGKPKVAPQLPSKSPEPSRNAPRTDVNQSYPIENAEHFRNQRGSSEDPIDIIDDSQDVTIIPSPKSKERHASVEVIKAVSSRSPKKTHRSSQLVEKPVQSIAEVEDMRITNDDETRSPMDELLSKPREEVHTSRASREASLASRRVRAAQNARATQYTAEKKDAIAKALVLDEKDEVIPDSPAEQRRSPSHGLPM